MKKRYIVLGIVALIAIILTAILVPLMCRPLQVLEKVTDPDRIIATYEDFFNTRADILTYQDQLVVANKAVETFIKDHEGNLNSYVNSTELSRLRAVAQGIENNLITTCQYYNANAKNLTRGIFKDWRLPLEIKYLNGKVEEIY